MRVDCYFTHQRCEERQFAGRCAVVIDVLRATSSIITALDNGAKSVIPVAGIAEALELAAHMPQAILAGERGGERLAGFDLGNSPSEFSRETVAGREIISCSTNGTQAIVKAAAAERLWLAALLNARAVAGQLLREQVKNLAILCSGTLGEPSLDDILAAGAVLFHLQSPASPEWNDSARIALRLYESFTPLGMPQALKPATHAQILARFGRDADVEYCAQENTSSAVPWFNKKDGRVYA